SAACADAARVVSVRAADSAGEGAPALVDAIVGREPSEPPGDRGLSPTTSLLANDIATLHLLIALEPDRELREIVVGFAAVVLDAVDELLRGRAVTIGVPRKVLLLRLAFGDEELRGLQIDVRAIHTLRDILVPGVRLAFRNLSPAPHLREVPDCI